MNNFQHFLSLLNLPNNIGFSTDLLILNSISIILLVTLYKIIRTDDLVNSVILLSLFSILLTLLYLAMDAPDVGMTEASVNACMSSIIMLAVLKRLGGKCDGEIGNNNIYALILCIAIACFFIYISIDLKEFGAPWAQVHNQVGKFYIQNTVSDIGIPSIVCAILASYRGFDTMLETSVIATSMLAVLFILSTTNKSDKKDV